jgi:hypothetical protein
MKKFKRTAALAVFSALILSASAVFADIPQTITDNPHREPSNDYYEPEIINGHYEPETNSDHSETEIPPVQADVTEAQAEAETPVPNFLSFTGDVREISPIFGNDGEPVHNQYYVRIQNRDYGTTVFRTDYNTFIMGEPIAAGDTITGWYASGGPMVLIYPPQHLARALVNHNGEFENVKIDRFFLHEQRVTLMSESGELVLNFTEQTPIRLQDGSEFYVPEGSALLNELSGRILAVTYGATDRMLPAATLHSDPTLSITVLWEEAARLPGEIEDTGASAEVEEQGTSRNGYLGPGWISNEGISVNNSKLEATWQRIGNAYYVPFRAVVDALGFGDTIMWDGDNLMITANNGSKTIAFAIDANNFIVGDRIASLDHPAILQGGTTYVPWQFFRDVFGVNARFNNGQIFVEANSETS